MAKLYVEYALSFGVQQFEGLWKIQYLHPYDASLKVEAWVPMTKDDERIGDEIADIVVARPGDKLAEVMGWLYDKITRYPYYWPKEGTYVDKFGYDFEVEINDNNVTSNVEISKIAYDILKEELNIQPPSVIDNPEIELGTQTIPGGGVLIKLLVTLDHSQSVSELNIAPFTKYPMELVSLMYEEDIETYHPLKELVLPEQNTESKNFQQTTESIRFQFPLVIAKRFTIILRQQNAEKNTYLVNAENANKKSLWDAVSKREAEVTLDTTDGMDTVSAEDLNKLSGWDLYLEQIQKYNESLAQWKKDVQTYKQKLAEREQAIADKKVEETRYAKASSEYRAEYNAAVKKYKTQVTQYQENLSAYNAAVTKYEKDLKIYNKYLRDYQDWEKAWT